MRLALSWDDVDWRCLKDLSGRVLDSDRSGPCRRLRWHGVLGPSLVQAVWTPGFVGSGTVSGAFVGTADDGGPGSSE